MPWLDIYMYTLCILDYIISSPSTHMLTSIIDQLCYCKQTPNPMGFSEVTCPVE